MSIFTRRHYIWLANIGRQIIQQRGDPLVAPERAIDLLAAALEAESPAFNRQRFIDAVYNPPKVPRDSAGAQCAKSPEQTLLETCNVRSRNHR